LGRPVSTPADERSGRLLLVPWWLLATLYVLLLAVLRPDLSASLLGFGALVIAPLTIRLGVAPDRTGAYPKPLRLAMLLQAPSAIALMVGLSMAGSGAGWLAVPWSAVSALVGLSGLRRILERGLRFIEETAVDVGCLFLSVSGVWAVLAAAGGRILGFDRGTIELAAVHFLYAGFVLPVIGCLVRRSRPSRLSLLALIGSLVGVPSQRSGSPTRRRSSARALCCLAYPQERSPFSRRHDPRTHACSAPAWSRPPYRSSLGWGSRSRTRSGLATMRCPGA
jgi:YndJ-like protein